MKLKVYHELEDWRTSSSKDSKKCDGADGGCGFVAEDMDLNFL